MNDGLVRVTSCNLGDATEEWVVGGWLFLILIIILIQIAIAIDETRSRWWQQIDENGIDPDLLAPSPPCSVDSDLDPDETY